MLYALSQALNRVWDVLSGVAEMAWDVLSGAVKMAWDVLSGVTKTAWDVLSGVANRCGMFCPGWQKMAWDVLSRDVLSYILVAPIHEKSGVSASIDPFMQSGISNSFQLDQSITILG